MGKNKSYGKVARRGVLWSIFRQGGHELIALPMSMIMARLLTPREFGVAVAASFFVALSARLTQFGLAAALVRVKELRQEHTSSVFVMALSLGALNYCTLSLLAPAIGRLFGSQEAEALLRLAAVTFLMSPFSSVSSALITRRMQFGYSALADWTDAFVGAIVTLALALAGWSYWSIVYGNLTAVAVRITLQAYLAKWRPSLNFSRSAARELLSYGLGIYSKRTLEYAALNLDNLVVGGLLDVTSLGFYDKAFSTVGRALNRLSLGQATFRIFAIIHEDQLRFQRAYAKLILGATLVGYPVLAAGIVAAEPLFLVLYGPQWTPAVWPFRVLCIGGMARMLNGYGSQANEAAGAIWLQVRRQVLALVLLLIFVSVGAYFGGILGAAVGVAAASVAGSLMMQSLVRRATGLTRRAMVAPQIPALAGALLVAAVMFCAGIGLDRVAPGHAAWQALLFQSALGAFSYVLFVVFSPFRDVRELVSETMRDLCPPPVLRMLSRVGLRY